MAPKTLIGGAVAVLILVGAAAILIRILDPPDPEGIHVRVHVIDPPLVWYNMTPELLAMLPPTVRAALQDQLENGTKASEVPELDWVEADRLLAHVAEREGATYTQAFAYEGRFYRISILIQ